MKLSKKNKNLGGLVAFKKLNADPGLTRFVFIILFLYPGTPLILIYLIFWLIMEKIKITRKTTQHTS